ncbi:MAG: RidA family protein [Alphaproteobacteria bacterium]
MVGTIETRLRELGIELPRPTAAAGNYVPFVRVGGLLFVAGQVPVLNGEIRYTGQMGTGEVSLEHGYQAARLCGLNLVAQARVACDGDLDRVRRVVRLVGFVNATADFQDHPKVLNGASDLMAEVFGDLGRHARAAVGSSSLPFGVTVEIEGVFEID